MRGKTELISLLVTGVVVVTILLLMGFWPRLGEAPVEAPEELSEEYEEQAPEDVVDEPASATGDIDRP